MKKNILFEILIFLFFTAVFSSFFYYHMLQLKTIHSPWSLNMLGLMWSPAFAAITTQLLLHQKVNKTIFKRPPFRYLVISYGIPLLYLSSTYLCIWGTGLGGFLNPSFFTVVENAYHFSWIHPLLFHILFSLTAGVVIKSVFALGEEWGWRGFLVPKLLQVTSVAKTAFISGIIWAAWHYPMILFLDYNGRTPVVFSLFCFTGMILGLSFLYTWMWLKTKSIWTVVLLHASHNLFIQQIFSPLTFDTGKTYYFIGEFGLGAFFVGIVLLILIIPQIVAIRQSLDRKEA